MCRIGDMKGGYDGRTICTSRGGGGTHGDGREVGEGGGVSSVNRKG
jgi:hypothetical protein